jgi:hypothetical protein
MNLISLWDRFDTKSHDFNKKNKKTKKQITLKVKSWNHDFDKYKK